MKSPIDSFISAWYGRSIEEMRKEFGILPFERSGIPVETSKNCQLLSEQRVIGSTGDLFPLISGSAVISGGPCIDDCRDDISVESVFEIASLIKVGKELKKKVIIHLGIEEEILRTKQPEGAIKKWKETGRKYEIIAFNLAKRIGYSDIFVCRSDDPKINSVIARHAMGLVNIFPQEEAKTLYQHLNKGKPVQKDSFNFSIHTRFLALYLPEFVSEVLSSQMQGVFVFEDLQQMMAAKKAHAICVLRNNFRYAPAQAVLLPFPAVDGSIRMHKCPKELRLFLGTDEGRLRELVNSMTDDVFLFNSKNWPAELTQGNISSRRALADFFCSLKELLGND